MLQTTDPHIITTQIDSLHTQVQIIDTTVTHVHVYDTIVTHVYDTIQPDLITVYERLITAQDDKFEFTLYLIAIIVTLLIVAVTAFNFFGAKELFKIEFEKMIESKREDIKKAALEDVGNELNGIKGEHARIMAISSGANKLHSQEIVWWSECVYYTSKSHNKSLLKLSVESLMQELIAVESISDFWEGLNKNNFVMKPFEDNLNQIPVVMTQRQEILDLFEKFKEECPDSLKGE